MSEILNADANGATGLSMQDARSRVVNIDRVATSKIANDEPAESTERIATNETTAINVPTKVEEPSVNGGLATSETSNNQPPGSDVVSSQQVVESVREQQASEAPPSGIIDAIHEASTTGGTSLSDGLMHTLGDHQTSANSEPRIPEFASSASPGSEARSLLIPDTPMTNLDAADEQFDPLYEASKESSLPVKSTAELATTTLFHQKLDLSREATFKQSYLRAKALNEHWSRIFS